jgi:hypothetical protein
MTSKLSTKDRTRGLKEFTEKITALRAKWPKAFPEKFSDVRPLASGVASIIADTFGWSLAYTRGLLQRWKSRDAYCEAVLAHPKRFTLDGLESGEEVDDNARTKATEVIERRKAKRQQEALAAAKPAPAPTLATPATAIVEAAPIATEPVVPAVGKIVGDELRARVRASLMRRRA